MQLKQKFSEFIIKTKQIIKAFFVDMRMLFKLQPLIFITVLLSISYGVVTIIIACIQLSYFIGITGICALILGVAKLYALKKYATIQKLNKAEIENETENKTEIKNKAEIENETARNIATCASVMAFLHFSIAVVCTFFEEESPSHYGLWFIFFVSGAAFVKVILSTVNAIRTRKNHCIIIHNVKLIDNANALIALGLTQRAIIYYVGDEAARWASGIGGMFFSLCALFVCLTMFMKYKYATTQDKKDS